MLNQTNTALSSLSLADNSIGKDGGMAMAETLQININLEHLNLANCDLVYFDHNKNSIH